MARVIIAILALAGLGIVSMLFVARSHNVPIYYMVSLADGLDVAAVQETHHDKGRIIVPQVRPN